MQKLKLPIIKGALPQARHLSMGDYLKFVDLNLKRFIDKKAMRRQKRLAAVKVKFVL